jgi:hypothetical protein
MLGDTKVNIKVGGDFDPIPMDKYTVQIADVNPVTQFNRWKGEDQILLNYQFVVLDDKPMPDGSSTRGRFLWRRVSQSLSGKSWLMKLVVSAYGRDLTPEEVRKFESDDTATEALEALIGKQVDVMVEQNPSKDGTTIFNNVVTFSKTLKLLDPIDMPAGQTVVETSSSSVVDTPDLTPEGGLDLEDAFAENLEKENAEAEDPEVKEMEEKLRLAKEKASKAKLKTK